MAEQPLSGMAAPSPSTRDAAAKALIDLYRAGRLQGLVEHARQVLRRDPDFGFAWKILGVGLQSLGLPALAELEKAAVLLPGDAGAHANLCDGYREAGRLDEAIRSGRQAVALAPALAEAHINLSAALHAAGQYAEAEGHARLAVQLSPGDLAARVNLGNALREQGRLAEAIEAYRQGLQALSGQPAPQMGQPDHPMGQPDLPMGQPKLLIGLGIALMRNGELDAAAACFRAAAQSPADALEAQGNLLFLLNYTQVAPQTVIAETRRYRELMQARIQPRTRWQRSAEPERQLTIGLVSGDFCAHPVGYFLESVLAALAGNECRLLAYRTRRCDDAVWARLRPAFAEVVEAAGLSDEALANRVEQDGVDILVDLAGHTAHGRPGVFARKPAPVQHAWLGYFASTGNPQIDYLLCDAHVLPPAEEPLYVEKPWRLPDFALCFTPPREEVAPAMPQGGVTFGCFNNLAKLNDAVLDCWSQLLKEMPEAKLLLKARALAQEPARAAIVERFARRGVGAGRLLLEGPAPRHAYLEAYRRVHVMLDPFPFPGGTTTVEGLWMGVPHVTLKGDRWIAHQGEMLLRAVGHPEWIAADEASYRRLARSLASDQAQLAALRQNLRAALLASPLCDAPRFAANLQAAWRGMWRQWCAEQGAPV